MDFIRQSTRNFWSIGSGVEMMHPVTPLKRDYDLPVTTGSRISSHWQILRCWEQKFERGLFK